MSFRSRLAALLASFACLYIASIAHAQSAASAELAKPVAKQVAEPPAQVMLIGLWHFDNPGLDAVKFKSIDVMRPAEQAYLEGLAVRLARFKPTRILLEYQPKDDERFNARLADWQAGKFKLEVNEIYQIGFRLAKAAGLKSVQGFDVRDVPGDESAWADIMKDPAHAQKLGAMIEELSRIMNQAHSTLDTRGLLLRNNSEEEDRLNKSFYLWLSSIGTPAKPYLGADLATQWWQRNFRMYHHIQKAAQPGERVVVIAGQGHTAVMRDFLRADRERIEVKPNGYF